MFKKRKCALCESIVDRFQKMDPSYEMEANSCGYHIKGIAETLNRKEYACPECYGVDRDRLYALFFRKLIAQRGGTLLKNVRLLHIAPSAPIQKFIDNYLGEMCCETMDLFMEGVDYQTDIQDMNQMKQSFMIFGFAVMYWNMCRMTEKP